MRVINASKNTILADKAALAGTFFKRIKGLLGKKDFTAGDALIIRPCNSIHTFFMRFPIDVAFVGKDNRVIKITTNMPAFRLSGIYFKALFVIEFPAHTLTNETCQINDILSFDSN